MTQVSLRCGDLATAAAELQTVQIGFANSTLFDASLMARLAEAAGGMLPGSFFLTFSKDLPCAHWRVLERYQVGVLCAVVPSYCRYGRTRTA